MTTAYGQPDKSLISCGFTRLDLFTSTCFCLSWCVAASVILGANGFWLRSILNPPQRKLIRLIINVEAQTAFNPGYPLTKRAIYYCSRMISAQHGPIFTNSEYGKIRKVYSIWVCTHPTKEFQNTLIRYSIRPEQLIGNAVEKSENYDLMSVVTICLGESGTENYTGIVKFMDVLLSSSRAATEKKKILEEEFGVAMNEDLEREVLVMCNLSQGVKAEGREEGISIAPRCEGFYCAQSDSLSGNKICSES